MCCMMLDARLHAACVHACCCSSCCLPCLPCLSFCLYLFSLLPLLSVPLPPPATIAVLHHSCKRARDSRGQLLQELKVRACVCLRVCAVRMRVCMRVCLRVCAACANACLRVCVLRVRVCVLRVRAACLSALIVRLFCKSRGVGLLLLRRRQGGVCSCYRWVCCDVRRVTCDL